MHFFIVYNQGMLKSHVKSVNLQTPVVVDAVYATYAYLYTPKFISKDENKDSWKLIYAYSGAVTIDRENMSSVLEKGQVFLLPPNEPYTIRANAVSCNIFIISFLCRWRGLYEIAERAMPILSSHKKSIIGIANEGRLFLSGMNGLPHTDEKAQFASSQVIKNTLELLLIDLIRNPDGFGMNRGTINSPSLTDKVIVNQMISYMEKNLTSQLKLKDVADHVSYSVAHVCELFKKTMGLSVISYFNNMRIDKAKELMAESTMSLRAISEYLGFETPQYFTRVFKKYCSMTPSQYLNTIRINNFSSSPLDVLKYMK